MIATSQRKLIICLDTALLIIFILLLSPRMTGLPLHEILGAIFFILVIVHLLVSWSWLQNTIRKFFKTATRRTRINFILNSILFILTISEIVSGFFISEVLLPAIGIKTINDSSWRAVHNVPLNFVVIFAGLHIAMNWGWIVSIFKKRISDQKQNKNRSSTLIMITVWRIIILIFAIGIVLFILYSIIGKPSLDRLHSQNEIGRFEPALKHGIIQFGGEMILIALYVFVARKWLRIKL